MYHVNFIANASTDKCKDCLEAKRFSQVEGINDFDIFSSIEK